MKGKRTWEIGLLLVCIIAVSGFLTIESTTKQGINADVKEIKIPLYLKSLDFMDRDLNYRWTVRNIVNKHMSDEQKADVIFQWTIQRIARQPEGLPVIDDHVWHIIVRGYGIADQMADVFATLCNYAGCKAFILLLKRHDGTRVYPFGAIYFNGAWHICDPWQSTEFVNSEGRWATISEIISGNWRKKTGNNKPGGDTATYREYFQSLGKVDFDSQFKGSRSSIQNPLDRLIQMFHSKERTTAKEKS